MSIWDTIYDWIVEPIITPFNWIYDALTLGQEQANINETIRKLKDADVLNALEDTWNDTNPKLRERQEIKNVYKNKKESLKSQGLESYSDLVTGWFGKQFTSAVSYITKAGAKTIIPLIDTLGEKYGISEEDRKVMKTIGESGEFGLNAIISFLLGITLQPAISIATEPIWNKARQGVYMLTPTALLPQDVLLRCKWRLGEVDNYKVDMSKYGYTKDDIERYEKVNKYYPSAGDFIHFAVREAYDDEVAERYGYDTGYPKQMEEAVEKAGMDAQWLKYFWRSHWEMISPRLGYEMLHRGEITIDDLKTILRIADYPPALIDPMVNISYRVFSRVDVRRMYRVGVLDNEGVKEAYLKLGYNEKDAQAMTDFSIAYEKRHLRNKLEDKIEVAFKRGEIAKDKAKDMLVKAGEDPEIADLWIWQLEDDITEEERDLRIDTVMKQYNIGAISYEKLGEELDGLELLATHKEHLLTKATYSRLGELSLPSKSDIEKWLKKAIIKEAEAKAYLQELNYREKDIENYMKEWIGKK